MSEKGPLTPPSPSRGEETPSEDRPLSQSSPTGGEGTPFEDNLLSPLGRGQR
jgi:hypothetical protein